MNALQVYQALWAMTGAPVAESFDRVRDAGFEGMAIDLGALSLDEARATAPHFARTGLRGLVTAFPQSIEGLRPALRLAHEIAAPFVIMVGQVMPLRVEQMAEAVRAWLRVAAEEAMPIQFETHRNCITNDLFSTLLLLDAVPEMRLSADLSHYVVDREMPCPPTPELAGFVAQVLERSDSFQGRVAARGQIQVALDFPQNAKWVRLFLAWWEEGLAGFAARAEGRDAIDLTPLAARAAELDQIARAHQERRRAGARMRARVTSVRNKVLMIAEAGGWPALSAEAQALALLRGDSRDPGQLAPVLARLEVLFADAEKRLTACASPVETDPMGTTDRPPTTPTNHLKIAEANTVVVGWKPLAHEKTGSRDRGSNPSIPLVGAQKRGTREGTASALRGFVVTPEFILQIAPQFRDWVGSGRPKWGELEEAATFVRSDLGISLHAWGQACVVLGRMEAVSMLAAIAALQAVGKVRSAGGLLRRMVDLHMAGELRLDRTLFGLADQHRPPRASADLHSARAARKGDGARSRNGR